MKIKTCKTGATISGITLAGAVLIYGLHTICVFKKLEKAKQNTNKTLYNERINYYDELILMYGEKIANDIFYKQ